MGRDLTALFDPGSVAVVGASDDPAKYGHAVASQALRADGRRPVHLVNRRGGTVLGRPAAPSLAAIGEPVELVVISVPGDGFEAAVEDALACGAKAIVGITAGFAEAGRRDSPGNARSSPASRRPEPSSSGPTAWASPTTRPSSTSPRTASHPAVSPC